MGIINKIRRRIDDIGDRIEEKPSTGFALGAATIIAIAGVPAAHLIGPYAWGQDTQYQRSIQPTVSSPTSLPIVSAPTPALSGTAKPPFVAQPSASVSPRNPFPYYLPPPLMTSGELAQQGKEAREAAERAAREFGKHLPKPPGQDR